MKDPEKPGFELSEINKENPFRVPEGYFDNFSARLQKRIQAEKVAVPVRRNIVVRYLKPAIGIAAGLALIVSLTYWPLKKQAADQITLNGTTEEITTDMLLANWVEGIDENSFYALLEEPKVTSQLSDEDLASYVNSNSTDYELYSETNIKNGK